MSNGLPRKPHVIHDIMCEVDAFSSRIHNSVYELLNRCNRKKTLPLHLSSSAAVHSLRLTMHAVMDSCLKQLQTLLAGMFHLQLPSDRILVNESMIQHIANQLGIQAVILTRRADPERHIFHIPMRGWTTAIMWVQLRDLNGHQEVVLVICLNRNNSADENDAPMTKVIFNTQSSPSLQIVQEKIWDVLCQVVGIPIMNS